MLMDKQEYQRPGAFCEEYGVVEETYIVEGDYYNDSSKFKRRKTCERFLPGVSPLIFTRFLLDNAVFLSLFDLKKELPEYKEIPVACYMRSEVEKEYIRIEKELKKILCKGRLEKRILSAYLNLLTSYPDQPYRQKSVYDPDTREPILELADIGSENFLKPKERDVIRLIQKKTAKGERVLVYTAWTRLDTQRKLSKALNANGN